MFVCVYQVYVTCLVMYNCVIQIKSGISGVFVPGNACEEPVNLQHYCVLYNEYNIIV
jgi:hypothetical protein